MILVLLADGFEEIEALTPIDVLRRAGADVKIIGLSKRVVTGSNNIKVEVDSDIDSVIPDKIKMLILPGGGDGVENLYSDQRVHQLIKQMMEKNCIIGAICAAPSILGRLGYLNNIIYTCYPGFEKFGSDGNYTAKPLEICGNIITAKGAGCAAEFSFALCEILYGKDLANSVFNKMMFTKNVL